MLLVLKDAGGEADGDGRLLLIRLLDGHIGRAVPGLHLLQLGLLGSAGLEAALEAWLVIGLQ